MENTAVEEPKGIPFYSIRTGETHWGKLEPTISAYINSSDMGINASRDQDYGWRLAPEWVQKVRAFKRNRQQMANLTTRLQGQKPTTVQILYYMYGEELANYYESMEENENPFEEEYLRMVNAGSSVREAAEKSGMPLALADFQNGSDEDDDIADLIDDVITEDDEETPTATADDKEVAAELDKQENPKPAPKQSNKKSTQK